MEEIRLSNITKIYKGKDFEVQALSNVNLTIYKGEMVAIMGTSGSGKTTLLNLLGMIDKPSGGSYFLQGQEVSSLSEKKLAVLRNYKIGFVLQDFGLIDYYTVEKNVMLPLYYSPIPKKEWKIRVASMLEKVGLSENAQRFPTELSGGQKQRVAIARSMITECDVLLADEPTGALDSKTSMDIMGLFSQIKEQNKTIIVVTHDSKIAEYCNRIYQIEDGTITSVQ